MYRDREEIVFLPLSPFLPFSFDPCRLFFRAERPESEALQRRHVTNYLVITDWDADSRSDLHHHACSMSRSLSSVRSTE